jgi:hypothetical protein
MEAGMIDKSLSGSEPVGLMVGVEVIQGGGGRDRDGKRKEVKTERGKSFRRRDGRTETKAFRTLPPCL